MRVVHVHRVLGVGGSERHLLTLLPALRARGIDARFLGLDDGDPAEFYAGLDASGVPYDRLRSRRDVEPLQLIRASRLVRRLRPDILHTHLVHADTLGVVASLAAGTRLVSTKHNDDSFRTGPYRHVERLLTRRASRVICISSALARFNRERVGLPADKLTVIHYGLDALPAPWGPQGGPELPEHTRLLLAVARPERQKGIDVAIDALARVHTLHPDAALLVLGTGSLEEELRTQARVLGLENAVYIGWRTGDVAAWLARAEVLVHPARWEGFGLALLEAMLARLPVVATNVSAIPEIVVDGTTGLLVPSDDAEALARAIEALLDDPLRAREMGVAGRARVQASFSVEAMTSATVDVYRGVLGEPPRASATTASAHESTE